MEKNGASVPNGKESSASGQNSATGDQNLEHLLERVMGHIGRLLDEDTSAALHRKDTTALEALDDLEAHPLRDALREVLAGPHARLVIELHIQTWLKAHPVKMWLWECYRILENVECLKDKEHLQELEGLLATTTPIAQDCQDVPALVTLLQRIMISPGLYAGGI